MFATTAPLTLRLSDRLEKALAAWAEAEGETVAGLVERILADAVHERRGKAKAAFEAARLALEETSAMLTKLLRKGPKAVLQPEDFFEGEPGHAETLRLLENPPHDDYAIDLDAVREAIDRAAREYRRAETALTAIEDAAATAAEAAAPQTALVSTAAVAAPARIWSRLPLPPAESPPEHDAEEAVDEDDTGEPRLSIPRHDPDGHASRLDLSLDAEERAAAAAHRAAGFKRLFVKGSAG